LGAELVASMTDLAGRHGATLFMMLLGSFAVLLARLADQHDIVIGTPVAGRSRRELENLIGLFVNTLPLRTRVDPATTLLDVLEATKKTVVDAFQHADLPFDRL